MLSILLNPCFEWLNRLFRVKTAAFSHRCFQIIRTFILVCIGNITDLARSTKGFNGADLEAVVNESIENCFVHNELKKSDVKLVLKVEMERVAKETISISKSCKEQIEKMQKVFKESSFRDASTVKKEQKASENNKK